MAGMGTVMSGVHAGAVLAAGPKVWLDMDQQALDDAYNQRKYASNAAQLGKRYAANSDELRARRGEPERFAYGKAEVEGLDVYRCGRGGAPIHIFIHGGAWRAGTARQYAFVGEPFLAGGAHYVVPDFSTVQDHGGDLAPLADQVRRAVAWVYANAGRFGGDARRIFISGHSSGAHLAGVVLTTDWKGQFGLPADVVKGAVLVSGMYDLKPVRLSSRREYVHLTDATEDALSAQRHLGMINAPAIVAWGTLETPEFIRQSSDFAAALKAAGKPVQTVVAPQYNHFEIIETLANPLSPLGRAALQQMGLA